MVNKKIYSIVFLISFLMCASLASALYYYPVSDQYRPSSTIQPYTTAMDQNYGNCIRTVSGNFSKLISVVKDKNWHNQYATYKDFETEKDMALFYKFSGEQACRNMYLVWNSNEVTRSNCLRLSKAYNFVNYQNTSEGCKVNFK